MMGVYILYTRFLSVVGYVLHLCVCQTCNPFTASGARRWTACRCRAMCPSARGCGTGGTKRQPRRGARRQRGMACRSPGQRCAGAEGAQQAPRVSSGSGSSLDAASTATTATAGPAAAAEASMASGAAPAPAPAAATAAAAAAERLRLWLDLPWLLPLLPQPLPRGRVRLLQGLRKALQRTRSTARRAPTPLTVSSKIQGVHGPCGDNRVVSCSAGG